MDYLVIKQIKKALCTDWERSSRYIKLGIGKLFLKGPARKYFRLCRHWGLWLLTI